MSDDNLVFDFAQYLEITRGRAASTSNTYKLHIERLEKWLIRKGSSLVDADRRLLEEYSGPHCHKEGLRPMSRRTVVAAIRSFYGYLVKDGVLEVSPATQLFYPKAAKPLPVPITRQNAERLLVACDLDDFVGARDAAIMAVLSGTGMRVSGVSSLNHESFDVLKNPDDDSDLQVVRVVEKGKKERLIPVPPETQMYLNQYINHPTKRLYYDDALTDDGEHIMFIGTPGCSGCAKHEFFGERMRFREGGIRSMITRRGEKLEIPADQLRPHAFRHMFGTEMTERDINTHKLAQIMGHEDIRYTERYIHIAVRTLRKAMDIGSPISNMNTPMNKIRKRVGQ